MSALKELQEKYKDVDPFLLYKWDRIFELFFDRNAGGDVSWGDFYLVTKKVKEIYGADSEQMRMAKSCLQALWDGLLSMADRNKDKVITIDEWIQLMKAQDPKKESKWFDDYMAFMFKLFDVSADKKLDIAEYADGMATYGFEEADAHAAFKIFSVDKKGKYIPSIDFPQFKIYWLEYFYSKDKKALGNNLFGVLKI